jgi:Family of unknown function (DUF6279)
MLASLALALLGACSAIKIAYNQAPDLAYWWLDGYVDFNEEQSPRVREQLTALMAWHRQSELPKVTALLQKSQGLLAANVTSAQACELFNEITVMVDAVIEKALPSVADLAPTITAQQLAAMQKKQQKTNAEFTKDYVSASPAQRNAKRLKDAIGRSERFYGKLEATQIAVIERTIQTSTFDASISLKERLQRQKDGVELMRTLASTKPATPVIQTSLRSYIARSMNSPDATYRSYAQTMVREGCDSFAAVHASTTPAQRANAVQTLKGYELDVRALIKPSGA